MTSLEFWEQLNNSNYAYTVSSKKRVVEVNDDVKNLKTTLDDLRKSVKSLKKYTSGVTSRDRLEKQLKDFVKSYNSVTKKADGITDAELKSELDGLDKLINDNEKLFKKIGITKNKKGKFEFDEDSFEDAETEDIDALFSGRTSFIAQANKMLGNIEKDADETEYSAVVRDISYTKKYDKSFLEQLRTIQLCASDAMDIAKIAGDKAEADKAGGYETAIKENISKIYGAAGIIDEMFVLRLNANLFQSSYKSEGLDSIKAVLNDESIIENLGKMGITPKYDDNGNFINFSADLKYWDNECAASPENSKAFCEAFETLFGENNTFANIIIEGCKKAFYDIVEPESLGVSIIDQHA